MSIPEFICKTIQSSLAFSIAGIMPNYINAYKTIDKPSESDDNMSN